MWVAVFFIASLLHFGAGEQSCTHSAKLDLQIIVDSSSSVGEKNFHTLMQKISRSVISQFEIGKDKTRVALFKYGCPNVMENEFSLDKFSEKTSLQSRIESTKYERGCTKTAMAMERARKTFMAKQRNDANTAKVCLVFTDGDADDAPLVPNQSQLWAKDGVTVYAIGIGKISKDGLKAIAGSDDRALLVDNFDEIGELAKSLLKKVCKTIAPTAAPQPQIPAGFTRANDGFYYRYYSEKKNWNDAENSCKRVGANLAIIWNQQTRDIVRGFMAEGWIGASDQSQEGLWKTPLNTPIPYSSWNRGEPNNLGNEDCTMQMSNKLWNDASCNAKLAYICQFRAGISIPTPQPQIPTGFTKANDGFYYRYHNEKKNWNDAENSCRSVGANLAIIWNQQTRDIVRGFMANGWIGASDQSQEGTWKTPLNTPIPYSSWSRGEPNNLGNEDCTLQMSNKLWNDASCNTKLAYICQFRAGASIVRPAAGIPLGYRRGNDGYYYRFHSQKINWYDAQNTCKREGGNLAIIWNQGTRDVVRGFMTEGWIGVTDQSQEGKWLTPLNTPIPYSSWGSGEPNNLGNEDCTAQLSNKLWNDAKCTSKLPFICQFKAGGIVVPVVRPGFVVHRPILTIHRPLIRPAIIPRPLIRFRIGRKEEEVKEKMQEE